MPKWVPKPHLYLDYNRFTLTDLAGAIKSRLVELDVEVRTVSPAERAAALARQQAFDAETRQLLTNSASDFMRAQDALLSALTEEAAAVSDQTGWQVAAGKGALIGGFVVSAQGQGLQIVPQNLYANTAREACLWIREYAMNLTVEQPGMRYFATGPMDFGHTRRLDVRRLPAPLGWCWELEGRVYSPNEAAQAIIGVLLDRIEKADKH